MPRTSDATTRAAREPSDIGERIHRLRTLRNLTQRDVAEPAYSAAYISTLEAGRARPSEAALHHIAERLGVTYDELLTGRPAHLATTLRAQLSDAQMTLVSGDAASAAVAYARLAQEAADNGFDDELSAAMLGLGHCKLDAGDLEEARRSFEAAERLLADRPMPRRVPAIRGRAVTHQLAGELQDACYILESAINELTSSGMNDPDALLLLYSASIAPYMDLGAHVRAARTAELALALAPVVSDPAAIAGMHRQVARTFLAQGQTAEADASLAKAADLYQQLHIRTELANCHWMRGYVHAQQGDLERAERELLTARDMLTSCRAALYATQVEVELADVLRRLGRIEEATSLLSGVLDGSHPDPGAVHVGGAHRLLGLIAEEQGNTERAEAHYREALTFLERAGATGDLADICRLLGDLLRRIGDAEGALDVYRAGLDHQVGPGTTTLGPMGMLLSAADRAAR